MSTSFKIGSAINHMIGLLWGTKNGDETQGESVDVVSGALHVANMAQEPGHDTDFDVVNGSIEAVECVVRTADGLQVTGACRIVGYVVHVAIAAGPIEVEDGLTAGAGTDRFIIPSGTAVGVYHFGGVGISCSTGAYLNFVGATGTVALLVQLGAGASLAT